MKYIKLYEDYSDDSDIINPIIISILDILKELQFETHDIFATQYRYHTITTIYNDNVKLGFDKYSVYFNGHRICNFSNPLDRDMLVMYIFKVCNIYTSLQMHLTNKDIVEIIFNKYPQYVKYYEDNIYNELSDEIKAKYSYLFKNELF